MNSPNTKESELWEYTGGDVSITKETPSPSKPSINTKKLTEFMLRCSLWGVRLPEKQTKKLLQDKLDLLAAGLDVIKWDETLSQVGLADLPPRVRLYIGLGLIGWAGFQSRNQAKKIKEDLGQEQVEEELAEEEAEKDREISKAMQLKKLIDSLSEEDKKHYKQAIASGEMTPQDVAREIREKAQAGESEVEETDLEE